jgi:hypothetical protein
MATKSIIEIDIQDEKFQAFVKDFEKLKNAQKAFGKSWDDINKKINQSDVNVKKFQKTWKDLEKTAKDAGSAFSNVASVTYNIAKNVASTTLSLGKWLTIGATVGGFGLGGLAASASDYRKKAQGLGISTGGLRAAETTLGRYINPESTFANLADIQSDLSKRQIYARLGGQVGQLEQGGNQLKPTTEQDLPTIIKNAVQLFNQGGKTQQFAEATGLTQVFTMEELRRLSSLSREELSKTINSYQENRKKLAVTDQQSALWQDFWYKLRESGQTLETGFIKALQGAIPELIALSGTVTDAIIAFLKSGEMQKAIEDFVSYIDRGEFKEDISAVFTALRDLAEFINDTFGFMRNRKEDLRQFGERVFGDSTDIKARETKNQTELATVATKAFMGYGLTKEQSSGIVGNFLQESGLNTSAEGDYNKKTGKYEAYGIGQWHPDRQKEFAKQYGHDIRSSNLSEQIDFAMYELKNTHQKAYKDLMKQSTAAGSAEVIMREYEKPAESTANLSKRVQFANTINLIVSQQTGGNTNVTANSLPGAQTQ